MKMYAIDMFCGAGGLTCGLRQAGIHVLASIDCDPAVEYACAHNNPGTVFIQRDIVSCGIDDIPVKRPLCLAGCPPCQPYSGLNRRHRENHPARRCPEAFLRAIVRLMPDAVLLEEVPPFALTAAFHIILRRLWQLGYGVAVESLNAADYGVPQRRRRLILLAIRHGKASLPRPTTMVHRTVRDAIGHLPPLPAGAASIDDRFHIAGRVSATTVARLRGDQMFVPPSRHHYDVYTRMRWDEPAPTITTRFIDAGGGRFGHPDQDRTISLREAALLQGFPAAYDFWPPAQPVNMTAVARMIGNAVPPPLARAVGEHLVRLLGARTDDDNENNSNTNRKCLMARHPPEYV